MFFHRSVPAQKLRREVGPPVERVIICHKFYDQNKCSKNIHLPRKMRFCAYASSSKTPSSRRRSCQCLFCPNKTPIFGQLFLCRVSASTRKSWLWLRLCGCGCPDETGCQTIHIAKHPVKKQRNTSQNKHFQNGPLNPRQHQREAIRRCIVSPQ